MTTTNSAEISSIIITAGRFFPSYSLHCLRLCHLSCTAFDFAQARLQLHDRVVLERLQAQSGRASIQKYFTSRIHHIDQRLLKSLLVTDGLHHWHCRRHTSGVWSHSGRCVVIPYLLNALQCKRNVFDRDESTSVSLRPYFSRLLPDKANFWKG